MSKRQRKTPSPPASSKRSRSQPVAPLQASAAAEAPTLETPEAAPMPEGFDPTEVFTLDDLVAQHGPASEDEINAYLEGATLDELTAEGAEVATERITRDTARLYGMAAAFMRRATPAQEKLLPGVTDDFLRVAIWCAYQGQRALEARTKARAQIASQRVGRIANSKAAKRLAAERRDVLYAGLLMLAGQKKELRRPIEQVYRRSTRPDTLAVVLRALVRLGQDLLKDASPAAQQRRRGSLLTEAFLEESKTLATTVATQGEAAEAMPEPPPVSQAQLDLWDGRNMTLLESLIEAFEAGHAADPVIPRLVPNSLRYALSRRRRARKGRPPRKKSS